MKSRFTFQRATVPRPRKLKRKAEATGSAGLPFQGRSRVLRSGKKIPFVLC